MENIENYAEWFFQLEALRALLEKQKNKAKSTEFAEFTDITATCAKRIALAEHKLFYVTKERVLFNLIKETQKQRQLNARSPFFQAILLQNSTENPDTLIRVLSFMNFSELLGLRPVSRTFAQTICSPYFYSCLARLNAGQEYHRRSISLAEEARGLKALKLPAPPEDAKQATVRMALLDKLDKNAEAQKFFSEDVRKLKGTVSTTVNIGQKMRERIRHLSEKLFLAR